MIPIKEFIESNNSCVLVKTDFKVDLDSLRQFFDSKVLQLKKTYQGGKRHGGWSVQSNTGEVSDGWQAGGTPGITKEKMAKMFKHGKKFKTPTDLYGGSIEQLINDLAEKHFDAKRTRFADLEPKAGCGWHIDGGYEVKKYGFWRGHIALKTNPECLFMFQSRDEQDVLSYNIPADGYLYLANINYSHRIENTSNESRIHILTDSALPMSSFQTNVEPILSFDNALVA
jgi:hypothetical protein